MDAARPRIGTGLGYQPGLDGLRAIAIVCVVAGHAGVPFTRGGGDVGVAAFFALSGFLITRLLVAERFSRGRIDLVAFYARRVLRLFPALLVLVAAVLVVYSIQGRGARAAQSIPVVLLYSANWRLAFGGETVTPFQHTWSLAIEEQFYIVWPPILLLLLRARSPSNRLALAVAIGAVGAAVWRRWISHALPVPQGIDRADFGSDMNAYALLAGCALGLLPRLPVGRVATALGILGLVGIAALTATPAVTGLSERTEVALLGPLAALGALGVICGAMDGRLGLLGLRPVAYVGRISYGLYLWHWVTPRLLEPWVAEGDRTVIGLALAIAATVVSFHVIERPALRLKARFRRVAGGLEAAPRGAAVSPT